MEDWISLREFARRRGVSLAAVQKAVSTNRVTAVRRSETGRLKKIDSVAATLQWNANTDPAEAAKNGKILENVAPVAGEPAEPVGPLFDRGAPDDQKSAADASGASDGKDPHGYQAARAERERLEVAARQLDYAKALGLVVSVEDSRRVTARRYRAIRDAILSVPDRTAAALAAERDPAQVHAVLTAELKRVLYELSDDAAAEVARGAAERVAA